MQPRAGFEARTLMARCLKHQAKTWTKVDLPLMTFCGIQVCSIYMQLLNSLAPKKFEWNLRHVIFKYILVIDDWDMSCAIDLIWMSLDSTDHQPTLVQVMDWCRQATSHYLSQCWSRSLSSYGVARPEWVKILIHEIKLKITFLIYYSPQGSMS